jgi:hypothetical protein
MFHHRFTRRQNPVPQVHHIKQNPRLATERQSKRFLFFSDVHQKSVNEGQIIPVFTLVWDDKSKSKREKIGMGFTARLVFLLSLCLSKSCEDS